VRSVYLLAVFYASACNPWVSPDGIPADLAYSFEDGDYVGQVFLEARGFVGPFRVDRTVCTSPIELRVKADARNQILGSFLCDLESDGSLEELTLKGEIGMPPEIDGNLAGADYDFPWTGWIYGDHQIYGEAVGETDHGGGRIEYYGWFDVAMKQDQTPTETVVGGGGVAF